MYMLAIETTGPNASVALFHAENPDGGLTAALAERAVLLGEKTSREAKNHLKNLMPLVRDLLADCGVTKEQLTHIAASVGPGSFTGIRIGVATARALAQVLELPCVAVPTLEAFLYAQEPNDADERVICGIINARRGQVYGILDGYLPGGPYLLTDVLAVITRQVKQDGRQVLFYGDGIDAYETQIISLLGDAKMEKDRDYDFAPQETRDQSAAAVGRAALRKLSRGETTDFANLLPDYMRQAEAEVKLAAGQLPICRGPKQE